MSTKFKVLTFLGVAAIVAIISIYVLEFQWLENTFKVKKLVWRSFGIGAFAGALVGLKLQKRTEDGIAKIQIWISCLLFPALLAPLVGSLANRLLSTQPVRMEPFVFFEEKPFAVSRFGILQGETITPDGYYIFFEKNGNLERIKSRTLRFPGVNRGDTIELPIKTGLLGFRFVKFSED